MRRSLGSALIKESKGRSSLQARVFPTQLVTTIPQLGNTRYYILMTAPVDLGYVLREGLSVQQFPCHRFTLHIPGIRS
jgi:hypothetical protein